MALLSLLKLLVPAPKCVMKKNRKYNKYSKYNEYNSDAIIDEYNDGYYRYYSGSKRNNKPKTKKSCKKSHSSKFAIFIARLIVIFILFAVAFFTIKNMLGTFGIGKEKTMDEFTSYSVSAGYNESPSESSDITITSSKTYVLNNITASFSIYSVKNFAETDFYNKTGQNPPDDNDLVKKIMSSLSNSKESFSETKDETYYYYCLTGSTLLEIYGPKENKKDIVSFANGLGY